MMMRANNFLLPRTEWVPSTHATENHTFKKKKKGFTIANPQIKFLVKTSTSSITHIETDAILSEHRLRYANCS